MRVPQRYLLPELILCLEIHNFFLVVASHLIFQQLFGSTCTSKLKIIIYSVLPSVSCTQKYLYVRLSVQCTQEYLYSCMPNDGPYHIFSSHEIEAGHNSLSINYTLSFLNISPFQKSTNIRWCLVGIGSKFSWEVLFHGKLLPLYSLRPIFIVLFD